MKDDEFKNIDFTFDPIFSCTNIRYDINSIIDRLIQESEIENEKIVKSIILNQHNLIFKYDNLINNNRPLVQRLFSDDISIFFLNVLESVIGLLNLSTEEIIFINKLIYDFFEHTNKYPNNELELEIKEKLLSISYTINANRIRELSAVIGINTAKLLSIISYSSFIDEKIIHRVNDFVVSNIRICVSDLYLVYKIIFGINVSTIANNLSIKVKNYIIYSMLEYWENEGHNIEEYKMFKNISDMILNILNIIYSMNESVLYSLLEEYANMIKLFNINKVRFSFKNISDVEWIKTTIKDLESRNIYIP